ncbi:MAG: helix-turn-helix transcriptional regulator [Lutibacter sp.]|jgi:transcriptional regulator with XRE-family HTH domain|nr:helix-turn-helix transcriptional regulator [Lutibacter sp.]
MKTIGNRLSYILERYKLTPYRISKETRISQSTIGRILKDRSNPNGTTLKLLCNYLGIYEQWLRSGMGEIELKKVDEQGPRYNKTGKESKRQILSHNKALLRKVNKGIEDLEKIQNPSLQQLKELKERIEMKKHIQSDLADLE